TTATCRVARCSANTCVEDDAQQGACNDGRYCTTNDSCSAGSCTGTARSCSGAAICDESIDKCVVSSACGSTSDLADAGERASDACGAGGASNTPYNDGKCFKFYCNS